MRNIAVLILAWTFSSGEPVEFTFAGDLMCAGSRIDVGSYAAPVMADWDGDGLQDLLCGQFDYGRIRFYRNEGSPGSPVFNGFMYLLDGAQYLSVPYG
ncbi:MAG: hypothetical protein JXA64_11205 [Candidatus Fermentibacteraceae bacterium]|nr:hypothetical protein [Candidatus Fermentibacteraceae bacterium]MBN2609672.1 hypothetical protein [Candidatus Fermentibacteraceae bacterium]